MLFTKAAVDTMCAHRSYDANQFAIFDKLSRTRDLPLIAIADTRGADAVIRFLDREGSVVNVVRAQCTDEFDRRLAAKLLQMRLCEFIIQPICWNRLLWHPGVRAMAA